MVGSGFFCTVHLNVTRLDNPLCLRFIKPDSYLWSKSHQYFPYPDLLIYRQASSFSGHFLIHESCLTYLTSDATISEYIGGSNISNPTSSHDTTAQSAGKHHRIFYGWVILATAFTTTAVGWGIYYSLAVFFKDMQGTFNANRAEISLVSSICLGTFFTVGIIYGWFIDKHSPRPMIGLGGLSVFAGMILSSRATEVWQLYIFLGLMFGAGFSATVLPYIAVLARWFVKRRGLVLGIFATGAGFGMMIFSPLSQKMLIAYGWRTTFDILGIIVLVLFSVSAFLIRGYPHEKGLAPYGIEKLPNEKDTASTSTNNDVTLREAIKGKNLWLALVTRMTLSVAIFMTNTHLVNFAKDTGMAATSAALLMTIVGVVSVGGKIGLGHLTDSIGSKRIVIFCAVLMGIVMLWLSSPRGTTALQLSAAVYGLGYGGSFALMNIIIIEVFGIKYMGRILGIINLGSAVGSLAGPWLAGYVFDTSGSYSVAFIIAAACSFIGAICTIPFGTRTRQGVVQKL